MNTEARTHLKRLLEGQRVLSLSVVIDGEPQIGLLPFAVLPDHTGVIVHVSSLARHTQALAEGKSVAVLIHQSEEAVSDPLQVPRVSMKAEVTEYNRGTAEYATGKTRYLARFPDAAITFELTDFRLFELRFVQGRYIEGFAYAMDITPEDLRAMEPPEMPKRDQQQKRRLWMIPRE
jgi:putative heme iron utilization protein